MVPGVYFTCTKCCIIDMLCKRKGLIQSPGSEIGQGFLCFVTLRLMCGGVGGHTTLSLLCLCESLLTSLSMWPICWSTTAFLAMVGFPCQHSRWRNKGWGLTWFWIKGSSFPVCCLCYLFCAETNWMPTDMKGGNNVQQWFVGLF